jgi:hypothetical protein
MGGRNFSQTHPATTLTMILKIAQYFALFWEKRFPLE